MLHLSDICTVHAAGNNIDSSQCDPYCSSWRGDPFLRTLKDMEKRLWRRVSLSTGAPLWSLEGGSFTRDFEKWMKGILGVDRL